MKYILATLCLLIGTSAYAADGDFVESATKQNVTVDVFKLCDGATGGATRLCTAFDLWSQQHVSGNTSSKSPNQRPPVPDAMSFSFGLATGCAGATTVMPMGSDESDLDTRYDILAAVLAKPSASEGAQGMIAPISTANRYITADIQTGTGCSDAEVWVKLFYFNR